MDEWHGMAAGVAVRGLERHGLVEMQSHHAFWVSRGLPSQPIPGNAPFLPSWPAWESSAALARMALSRTAAYSARTAASSSEARRGEHWRPCCVMASCRARVRVEGSRAIHMWA